MALRKSLTKSLYTVMTAQSQSVTVSHSSFPTQTIMSIFPPNAVKTNFHREYSTSPETSFLRRIFSLFVSDHIPLHKISPPPATETRPDGLEGIRVHDVRKILKLLYVQKLKIRVSEIEKNSITYNEFVKVCVDGCGGSELQGEEFAKLLDEAGDVIVLGNVVFLRPEQVAKSIETIISQSISLPNDPRKTELDHMENQKTLIDKKAQSLVKRELYCGLGFIILQTIGFMRLTFWELGWDVMEPICFFVASLHFAGAYGFFLKTKKEPSFEAFFRCRFKTKQKKLMLVHGFDVEKYEELCKAFYPK